MRLQTQGDIIFVVRTMDGPPCHQGMGRCALQVLPAFRKLEDLSNEMNAFIAGRPSVAIGDYQSI